MNRCDFCDSDVIAKQRVYEDDLIVAIYPKKSIIFHHIIVFPKKHFHLISDIPPEETVRINQVFEKIYLNFKNEKNCIGFNLTSNNGSPKIGQTIPHCHFHMYLRFDDETISPYKVINDPTLKEVLTPEEWKSRKETISEIINRECPKQPYYY